MLQVLLIAVFAVLFVREDMGGVWLRLGDGTVAAITLGSLAGVWAVSHTIIWCLGRRLDQRGDLRTVAIADTVSSAARLAAVVVHVGSVLGLGWLDVVRARVGNHPAADDLVQETLVRVLAARSRIEPGMLESYTIVTARNVVASMWRDLDRRQRNQHKVVDLRPPVEASSRAV